MQMTYLVCFSLLDYHSAILKGFLALGLVVAGVLVMVCLAACRAVALLRRSQPNCRYPALCGSAPR